MYALFHSLPYVKSCTSVVNYYLFCWKQQIPRNTHRKIFLFSIVEREHSSFWTLKHEFKKKRNVWNSFTTSQETYFIPITNINLGTNRLFILRII